ncbi:conserved hypothetical protein [Thermosulfidibacter takaii ABI70S6]|uniref:VTT domain-containing protein n=1 Tax=Thermosulfidibacter takaii (strain DSM 17441 / JCM 13301 / NBRC 103674 / ABI70S6) TaxID=1298851 RepID=A0A0S3QW54_THET7|nr:DedA family protein [Thermosulfidibacter takaii]BAT72560.1 conserved hypothetical protein [Thermosulfidibacter takaii ABI70S6]
MKKIALWIVNTVGGLGYPGIFFLMFLESSFFPFPSEVVMPPAGYLAAKGRMSLTLAILMGVLGSVAGAWFNYFLAVLLGRPFLEKYGKYFLISHEKLEAMDRFFERHGSISMFVGRLLPGVRQYISLPAGLSRMNLAVFTLFTALGAGIWVTVLALIGYFVGNNEALLKEHLHTATVLLLIFSSLVVLVYWWYHKKK